jgi:hypothetical protein
VDEGHRRRSRAVGARIDLRRTIEEGGFRSALRRSRPSGEPRRRADRRNTEPTRDGSRGHPCLAASRPGGDRGGGIRGGRSSTFTPPRATSKKFGHGWVTKSMVRANQCGRSPACYAGEEADSADGPARRVTSMPLGRGTALKEDERHVRGDRGNREHRRR